MAKTPKVLRRESVTMQPVSLPVNCILCARAQLIGIVEQGGISDLHR